MAKLITANDDFGGLNSQGQRLRRARSMAGLSGPVIAKELGITRSALSQMELDKMNIPGSKIETLAQILLTTPDWLKHGKGLPPRWPERPVMVPEMDLEHIPLDPQLLLNGDAEGAWLRYRNQREWAIPASEARRLGINQMNLIAVRVTETIPPEFRPGDFVVLDCAAKEITDPGYYGLIIDRQFMLTTVKEVDRKSLMVARGGRRAKSIAAKDVSVIGPIVYRFGRPSYLIELLTA